MASQGLGVRCHTLVSRSRAGPTGSSGESPSPCRGSRRSWSGASFRLYLTLVLAPGLHIDQDKHFSAIRELFVIPEHHLVRSKCVQIEPRHRLLAFQFLAA